MLLYFPHIQLLDALINNCGKNFHLEIASREFETEFKKLLAKSQPQIVTVIINSIMFYYISDYI